MSDDRVQPEWWERVCRPIRHDAPGGPADVPPRTWALVLQVNARMRSNAQEDMPDLAFGADPARSLAFLGLPARPPEEEIPDSYYALHRSHLQAAARQRARQKRAKAA